MFYAQFTLNSVLAKYQFDQVNELLFSEKESEGNIDDTILGLEITDNRESESIELTHQNGYFSKNNNTFNVKQSQLEQSQIIEPKMPGNPEVSAWEGDAKRPEVFARIIIPKIELIAPVIHGVSEDDIKLAVGHMPGTEKPGEWGNSVYAGHRSHTFGRFFNRLAEVEVGDVIIIETIQYKYTYVVFDMFIVYPDEIWVTEDIEGKAILTLVTCDPLYGNSHRLIVRGELQ